MPAPQRVFIIATERPFDEEQWKRLLTAFAYVLHEQRKTQDKRLDDICLNPESAP